MGNLIPLIISPLRQGTNVYIVQMNKLYKRKNCTVSHEKGPDHVVIILYKLASDNDSINRLVCILSTGGYSRITNGNIFITAERGRF